MPFIDNTSTPQDRPMDTSRRSGYPKVIKQSIPSFILDEYPLFVEFLEAYYEWLDQNGNPMEFLQNGSRYFDIDTTSSQFLEYFKSMYLEGFAKRLASDENRELNERTLIKNIREIYKIKGSEKSIQLMFRLIAASDTSIEYPRDYIFSLSSGNYQNYHKIHVLKDYTNLSRGFDPSAVEGLVLGQYEGVTELIASATMLRAYEIAEGGKEYFVFLVSNPNGEFIKSDFAPLKISQGATAHEFYPVYAINGVNILNGGSNYSAGEFLTIGNTGEEHIKGFISQTDYNGKITGVRLFSSPVDYKGATTLTVDSPLGTGASLSLLETVISSRIDEYADNKNLLSRVSKIQDSFEYQQYSYIVKSKRSLEEYIDIIKKIVHPSGFVIFNALYNNIYSLRPTQYGTRAMAYERTSIGSYSGYRLQSDSGGLNTGGWNVYSYGRPKGSEYPWGYVFSRWSDAPNTTEGFNPSETIDSVPDQSQYDYGIGGTFAKQLSGGFFGVAILPNPSEFQKAGITHYLALPHPSVRGVTGLPAGTKFQDVRLIDILQMPVPIV
jgi:hypothetical protein